MSGCGNVCRFCTGELRVYEDSGPMRKCERPGGDGFFCGCCRETADWCEGRGEVPEIMCYQGERID